MATNTNTLINNIYRSRLTLLDLLDKQGYDISDYSNFSINEIHIMVSQKQLDMLMNTDGEKEDNIGKTAKKVFVKYHLAKTLRPNHIYEYVDDLFSIEEVLEKKDTLIIIVKDEPNDTLITLLKHIWANDGVFIILLNIKRLQFNPLNHTLVPPHKVINETDVVEVKKRYNITRDSEFPEISRFDPIAQAIGIRPGEVCEIIRPSKTAIDAKFYRLCK